MNLGPDIVHDAQALDSFDQFRCLQLVRRPRHDVDTNPTFHGADQPLYDNRVLIAFVLEPERLLRRVYEGGNTFAAVVRTPDEAGFSGALESSLRPIGGQGPHPFPNFSPAACSRPRTSPF